MTLKKILLPAAILASSVAVFVWLKSTRPLQPQAEIQERVWRVEAHPVELRTLGPTLTLTGRVETSDLLKAAAPAEAVVAEIPVKEGERVRSGQRLLRFDPGDFLPRLGQAQAELRQLEAEMRSEESRHAADGEAIVQERAIAELAHAAVVRAEKLQKKSATSESALDEARQNAARQDLLVISRELSLADHDARIERLSAQIAKAKARVEELQLEFRRSDILAPFDGVIARVAAARGDRVRKAEAVVELYDPATLEVRARIPSPFRDELQQAVLEGTQVQATAPFGGSVLRLHLDRLSGRADPTGIDALFRVGHGLERLRLGDLLELDVRRPPREGVATLPYSALFGGKRVYVLEDGRLRGVEVEVIGTHRDPVAGEQVVLLAPGLASGDLVVVTHLPNAVTGLRAEVAE